MNRVNKDDNWWDKLGLTDWRQIEPTEEQLEKIKESNEKEPTKEEIEKSIKILSQRYVHIDILYELLDAINILLRSRDIPDKMKQRLLQCEKHCIIIRISLDNLQDQFQIGCEEGYIPAPNPDLDTDPDETERKTNE